jgi:hypothetical protein
MDADQRVEDALKLVFVKFTEFQGIRQVHVWLRDEGIVLLVKSHNTEGRDILWRLPAYNTSGRVGGSAQGSGRGLHHLGRV